MRVKKPAEQREEAERVLRDHCAWCLRRIPDDAPVQAVYVTLEDDGDPRAREGGLVTIRVGDRRLPLVIAEAGSPASAIGDAAFMLCSHTCAAALTAAIAEDLRMTTVH